MGQLGGMSSFPEPFRPHTYLHCLCSKPLQLKGKQGALLSSLDVPLKEEGLG